MKTPSIKKLSISVLLILAFSGCASTEEDPDKPGMKDYLNQVAGLVTSGEHLSPEQAELDRQARSLQTGGTALAKDESSQ